MPKQRRNASRRGAPSFADVPVPRVGLSKMNRSHSVNTAFNAGQLVPIFREELLPGDTLRLRTTIFARLTTLVDAVFSNVFLDVLWFAVPLRHIWENAGEFFGAEPGGPGTRVDRLTPKLDVDVAGGVPEQSLHDYIGIPPGIRESDPRRQPHNFYGRAYYAAYNSWIRDAEIQAPLPINVTDSADAIGDFVLQRRYKQRDRFTSARPWPYKGPDVNLSLGTSAPVTGDIVGNGVPTFDVGNRTNTALTAPGSGPEAEWSGTGIAGNAFWNTTALELQNGIVDLTAGIGPTVNDFRNTIALQHIFEQFARAGSARYVEWVQNVYGVRSPDSRQQEPEFIGQMSTRLMVNPVYEMASGLGKLGDSGAYALALKTGRTITYSSTEHQVVLGLANIRAEYIYSQGLDKDFRRDNRFDYHFPHFEGLGEQPIYQGELYWQGTPDDDLVFGYEPRHQDYRERHNYATGRMRPQSTSTLASWHLGEEFSAQPLLNPSFLEEDPPFDRVTQINASVEPSFKVDVYHDEQMIRPVAAMGMPGLRRI